MSTATTPRRRPIRRLVALAILPALVAGLLAWAFWTPDTRLENVTAAIVNDDDPVTVDGKTVPLGRELAADLASNGGGANYDWVITTAADASDGLDSGDYVAVVTIPKGFSASATSTSGGGDARRAVVDIATSGQSAAIDDAISAEVVNTAADTLGSQVSRTYLKNVYVGFNTIHDNVSDASDGASELTDGTDNLAGGAAQLSDGADDLADGASRADSGAQEVAGGAVDADQGAQNLAGAAHQVAAGADDVRAGAGRLVDATQRTSSGAANLTRGSDQLVSGLGQLSTATRTASTRSDSLAAGAGNLAHNLEVLQTQTQAQADALERLSDSCAASGAAPGYCAQVAGLAGAANDPQSTQQMAALVSGGASVAEGATSLSQGLDRIDAGADDALSGAQDLRTGAGALAHGSQRLTAGASNLTTGAGRVARGARAVASGANTLAEGTGSLRSGTSSLAAALSTIQGGATTLSDRSTDLASGAAEVDHGSRKLATSLADGQDQVPTYTRAERDQLAHVVSEPIDVKGDGLDGGGPPLAWYLVLALWVGALGTFLVLPAVPRRAVGTLRGPVRSTLRAFAPAAVLAVAQASLAVVVLGVADRPGLGHGIGLLAASLLAAVTFAAVNQALVALAGGVGRLVSVAVAALAVAFGAIATIPGLLSGLAAFLPVGPARDLLGTAVGDQSQGGPGAVLLVIWALASLLGTTLAIARSRSVSPRRLARRASTSDGRTPNSPTTA